MHPVTNKKVRYVTLKINNNKGDVIKNNIAKQTNDNSNGLLCQNLLINTDKNGRKFITQNGKKLELTVLNLTPVKESNNDRKSATTRSGDSTSFPTQNDGIIKTSKVISTSCANGKPLDFVQFLNANNRITKSVRDKATSTDSTLGIEVTCQTDCGFVKHVHTQTDNIESVGGSSPFNSLFSSKDFFECLDDSFMGTGLPEPNLMVATKPTAREQMAKLHFFQDLRNCLVPNKSGNMAVHDSVLQDDYQALRKNCIVLKARQKIPDLLNSQGFTPLHLAILEDVSIPIVETLLEFGSDMTITDLEGNSAVHLAVEYNRTKLLKILMQDVMWKKINLDLFNYEGVTPLMISCINKSYENCLMLLEYGASPNIRDKKSGKTALFHAAEAQDENIVELLISYRADTKIRNFFGTSPHDAMFEVENMPAKIKQAILGRDHGSRGAPRKKPQSKKVIDGGPPNSKFEMLKTLKRVNSYEVEEAATKKRKPKRTRRTIFDL